MLGEVVADNGFDRLDASGILVISFEGIMQFPDAPSSPRNFWGVPFEECVCVCLRSERV